MASRLPTSRSYWTLRAEQVMDRVFDQQSADLIPVDVAVQDYPPAPASQARQAEPSAAATPRPQPWLVPALSGVAIAGLVSSVWLVNQSTAVRSQLDLERQLLLLNQMREAPQVSEPSTKAPSTAPTSSKPDLPPPPLEPEPEWVSALEPLTVPVQPVRQGTPPPPAVDEVLPVLTGVVQGPGGSSSAIFQINNTSLSLGVGDAIGSSGWSLDAVNEAGAVIARNGERRTLSVGGLF